MTKRKPSTSLICGICLPLTFSSAASSDEQAELDKVAETFMQVIRSVEADFDCLINVVALEEPDDEQSDLRYFATFVAAGSECPEASDELGIRGVRHGIVFFRGESTRPRSTGRKNVLRNEPTERILDLIHEINPPIEE